MKLLDKEGLEYYTGKVKGTLTNFYTKTETNTLLNAKENSSNKVTSITISSTDTQYPSAKCVYDSQTTQDTKITNLENQVFGDETIEGEGTSLTLNNTLKGVLNNIILKGNTSQNEIIVPTPSAPSPIYVVSGDNKIILYGENIINKSLYKSYTNYGLTFSPNSDGSISISGTTTSTTCDGLMIGNWRDENKYIKLDTNSTYTVGLVGNTNSKITLYLINYTSVVKNTNSSSSTFTPSYDSVGLVMIRYTGAVGDVVNTTVYPMLVKGSTTLSTYEPEDTYNIDLPIENLIDTQYFQRGSIDGSTGQDVSSPTNARGSNYIPVLPNTSYTISVKQSVYQLRLSEYQSDNTHIKRNTSGNNVSSYTITTSSNCYFVRWSLNYNNSTATTQEIINGLELQLEKGTKVNSYTPFGTTPIELCKIGNYVDFPFHAINGNKYYDSLTQEQKDLLTYDKWYLHKEIGKKLYNGSENWTYKTNDGTNYCFADPDITGYYHGETILGLSNYFSKVVRCSGYANALAQGIGIYFYYLSASADFNSLYIVTNTSTTANDLKTWLSTHNTEVYYPLATPTNTEITYQPLIDQLNAIEKATSKENQTNISQVNNDLPFILEVSAFKNNLNGKIGLLNKLTEELYEES